MAGTMSEADLVVDLKASLLDSAGAFTAAADADFKRHLGAAALAFNGHRPRTLSGSVALVADEDTYVAPADLHRFKFLRWGAGSIGAATKPWEKGYPGRLPTVREVEIGGALSLVFDPAPSAEQIFWLGAEAPFFYYGRHAIAAAAAQTTIRAGDRGLLILRAQAEAMRELAMRGVTRPMAMRDGFSGMPSNGSPAALAERFLDEFNAQVRL